MSLSTKQPTCLFPTTIAVTFWVLLLIGVCISFHVSSFNSFKIYDAVFFINNKHFVFNNIHVYNATLQWVWSCSKVSPCEISLHTLNYSSTIKVSSRKTGWSNFVQFCTFFLFFFVKFWLWHIWNDFQEIGEANDKGIGSNPTRLQNRQFHPICLY